GDTGRAKRRLLTAIALVTKAVSMGVPSLPVSSQLCGCECRWLQSHLVSSYLPVLALPCPFVCTMCGDQIATCKIHAQMLLWITGVEVGLCRKSYVWVHMDMKWIGLQHVLLFSAELHFQVLVLFFPSSSDGVYIFTVEGPICWLNLSSGKVCCCLPGLVFWTL
uniref:Uncharacterized protein n=1 Tax=Corvus moneduloides TaxID=1196302 RepID=A0A8C3D2N5_CORMO